MATEVRTNVASPGAAAANAPAPAAPSQPEAPQGASGANPPAVEAPKVPETPKQPEKQEIDFGTRFAALTKKERQILERDRALKAQEKEFTELKKAREQAQVDPIALLKAHGLTYDQVTQFVLNDGKLTEAQRIAMLEDRLKKEDETKAEAAKREEKERVERAISEHQQAIGQFLSSAGDDFEITKAHGDDGVALVYSVIEQHYSSTFDEETQQGQILSIEEAAKAVEAHLEKQARDRVLSLKRFQPKSVTSDAETPAPPPSSAEPETKRPAPTLTNAAVASAPPPDSRKDLSDEESKRRAASMLRWDK